MPLRQLHISPDLTLPRDAVTSTIVVYGGKGMGKTNLGAVLVEELAAADLRWAVIDPMGVWWGMRHSSDGKSPGVECLILGGAHGDIPIESTGGAIIADLVADHASNVIIDISRNSQGEMWSIGQRIRFMTDYGKQLFRRQGSLVSGQRREPICQIIDEAARYIPQMIRAGQPEVAMCASTWSTIVEEGRNVGLGVVLLTQRSARLNKDVAELADVMLAFRTVGPNSIDAVMDWLGEHVPKDKIRSMAEQVRSLPVGSCLAVSPGWLGLEQVIRIRRRTTFDSSATPKPGEQAVRVRGDGAKPDLAVYAARMKETIERAAADDPQQLKRRIKELEQQVVKPVPVVAAEPSINDEELKMLKEKLEELAGQIDTIEADVARYKGQLAKARGIAEQLVSTLSTDEADRVAVDFLRPVECEIRHKLAKVETPRPAKPASQPRVVVAPGAVDSSIPLGERKVLTVLAQYQDGLQRQQVGVFSGYSARSTRDAYIARLGSKNYVEAGGNTVKITAEGLAALGSYELLPVGKELQDWWLSQLPKGEAEVLRVLCAKPSGLTREEIGQSTGYEARSTRDAYIARVASKLLIDTSGNMIKASSALFD